MSTNEAVGRRVRLAREELRLSQGELGRLLSRPRTHAAVSDIERGKTKLDVEDLADLARVLQKDISYFYEQPVPSVVYRRSERGLTPAQQRAADDAVERFKQLARERARRDSGRQGT